MKSPKTLLDTDVLSSIMRRDAKAFDRAQHYLTEYPQLSFSLITRFEILRGLKAKMAAAGVRRFDHFCAGCEIVPVTEQIVVRAADIYADLYQRGELIGDADILIAATAMINGFVIASNNAAHFGRITGLQIDNWSI